MGKTKGKNGRDIMCSTRDVKNMVYEAFDEKGGLRSQIQQDTKQEIKLAAFNLIAALGISLLIATVTITIYLTNIRKDVDSIEERVDGEIQRQINSNADALENVATKDDIDRLEASIIRLWRNQP